MVQQLKENFYLATYSYDKKREYKLMVIIVGDSLAGATRKFLEWVEQGEKDPTNYSEGTPELTYELTYINVIELRNNQDFTNFTGTILR